MTDTSMRSIFKNDSAIGRHLDGEDDSYDDSPRSSITSSDNETLITDGSNAQQRAGAYNTGPKGVRSDAWAFKASQSSLHAQKLQSEADRLSRIPQASTWSDDSASQDARERWVEKRLKELSKSRTTGLGYSSTTSGTFEPVDAAGYLETIESSKFVCVLIYSDSASDGDEESEFIECLPPVFARYVGLRLIKLHHSEAEIDVVACPALLNYEDGELSGTCMRAVDELESGEEMSRRNVEAALVRCGVLKEKYRILEG